MEASSTLHGMTVAEAEKVAQRAAAALKESRKRCAAPPGVPTWTGQHGEAGAPKLSLKPRFGAKSQQKMSQNSSEVDPKLFSGKAIGKQEFIYCTLFDVDF